MTNDPAEVGVYRAAMEALVANVALSVEDSMGLLDRLLDEPAA